MRFKYFLAGMITSLILEGLFVLGLYWNEAPPAVAVAAVERHITFKVLAPKGYEDFGHIAFDCKPRVSESHYRSGRKSPTPWKKP